MIHIKTPGITKEAKRYLQKFGKEAVDEIIKTLKKIGEEEVRNTQSRLATRSTASGDIFDKVADEVTFDIVGAGPTQIPVLRFGAGDNFTGIIGSRGENIAGILAFGKKAGKPLKQRKLATPAKKSGTGFKLILQKGYVSPAREAEEAFLPKAEKNIEEKIEKRVPEALRKAFDEVKV
tara:strand:+ start:194 stop:727 length:534 start_codon:yes stop_codon:yes gene_type:complete